MLRQFASRLLDGIRETDAAARLAGDEFVVILAGGSVPVGASIGLALQRPHEVQDPTCLLARADQAIYAAKRKGKGRATTHRTRCRSNKREVSQD